MQIFISHSSNDHGIAKALIDLLEKSLSLSSDQIRCTSLDGYRMKSGVQIDETLRSEVHDCALLIGLITPSSIKSAYVIFELGARWGAEKPLIPLLASGITPDHLEGPLKGINTLDATEEGQVHQLVEEVAQQLELERSRPSSYQTAVRELAQVSQMSQKTVNQNVYTSAIPQLSDDAKELLVEAVKDRHRMILMVRMMGGMSISTNGREFCEAGNVRSEARWEQAVRELCNQGLVVDPRGEGQGFEVTHLGFELADDLTTST